MTEKEAIAKAPVGRPRRTSLERRQRLSVRGKEDGYVYRIVNDVDDRVEQLLELGYEHVPKKAVTVGDKRVERPTPDGSLSQVSVGGGTKAFVMRIKDEFYKEDQASKQAYVDKTEQATKQQALDGNYGKIELQKKK